MSNTKKEYCKTECSEQCEDDETCNEECMEYCTTKTKPKSGMFDMLFSGWGLLSIICCCFLLIGVCLFFLFKKGSNKPGQMGFNSQMSNNPYAMSPMQPFPGQQGPFPGQGQYPGPSTIPTATPRFDPITGQTLY